MWREALTRRPLLLLIAHAAAFWPVWVWYVDRLDDGSDEPWALVALGAALFVSWPARGLRIEGSDPLWTWAALLSLSYAVCAPFAPPLVRAALAVSALGCSWTSLSGARGRFPATLALLALSLPVLASLQFYLGYPMRVLTAAGATDLLQLAGHDVARAGTSMTLDGRSVLVDAPCSGVRMWWTACLLCCVLAAQRPRLTMSGMALTLTLAIPAVLTANVVRAALLFLLETGAKPPPGFAHALVGIGTFSLVALLLLGSESLQTRFLRAHRSEPATVSS